MFDSISDTAFWSTSAEVIAGLVVAIVFADVAGTEPRRDRLRWYSTLQWTALIAIAGGLGGSLLALADERLRRPATAIVILLSVALLGVVVGIRIVKLRGQARHGGRSEAEAG